MRLLGEEGHERFKQTGYDVLIGAKMDDQALRKHLKTFLEGRSAHANLEAAVTGLPLSDLSIKPPGTPHTIWQLVEHIRIALEDLVSFSTNPQYTAPNWPQDYWPSSLAPAGAEAWNASLKAIKDHIQVFVKLIEDPATNFLQPFPWGEGQTLLHEILLAGDHAGYHIGQIVLLRQQLGNWKPS